MTKQVETSFTSSLRGCLRTGTYFRNFRNEMDYFTWKACAPKNDLHRWVNAGQWSHKTLKFFMSFKLLRVFNLIFSHWHLLQNPSMSKLKCKQTLFRAHSQSVHLTSSNTSYYETGFDWVEVSSSKNLLFSKWKLFCILAALKNDYYYHFFQDALHSQNLS